ncbi:SIS domain-containing protein [Phytoactinopolyspora endophytica]|uniref:SIS domain-containing protein n=1 Tax=Phytoactinopolyspora endophytica TaxID=1642495 RepID=UPI00101CDAD4|nr:SIS domain-containing protein [Phytoactinopolyspora endophytica]
MKRALMANRTPFEDDIRQQGAALRQLADTEPLAGPVPASARDDVVLTGMGSSHFAGIPTWRRLVRAGHSAWDLDAGQLLDAPELAGTGRTVVVTSQSGASGEIVGLLDARDRGAIAPSLLIGVVGDQESPLAARSDIFLPLCSGPEATVSTKSYLNTLGMHRLLAAGLLGERADGARDELRRAADLVERAIASINVADVARDVADHPHRRLAFVGRGDNAATALYAGLITKEAAKIPAEGFIGGQFRHGPFELAGDGLTVVLFGSAAPDPDRSLRRLAEDLVESGSRAVLVGDDGVTGAVNVPVDRGSGMQQLAVDAVVAQLLAVELARANGVVPGQFLYGNKITTVV